MTAARLPRWRPRGRLVLRDRVPILALEQDEGMAWTAHHTEGTNLLGLYEFSRHNLPVLTLELLRLTDNV